MHKLQEIMTTLRGKTKRWLKVSDVRELVIRTIKQYQMDNKEAIAHAFMEFFDIKNDDIENYGVALLR